MPNPAYEQHEVKQEVESSRPEPVSRVDDMGRSIESKVGRCNKKSFKKIQIVILLQSLKKFLK